MGWYVTVIKHEPRDAAPFATVALHHEQNGLETVQLPIPNVPLDPVDIGLAVMNHLAEAERIGDPHA